jgi:5-methylthioribose kinase
LIIFLFIKKKVQLTQQVIFQEPFYTCNNNKWTHDEELTKLIIEIQNNDEIKLKSIEYLNKFRNNTEALIHGDLRKKYFLNKDTGSILCNENRTVVLDPEFSFYGPMSKY